MQGASGAGVQIGYDANGQPVAHTDALNQTTRQTLDGLRRRIAVRMRARGVHTFGDYARLGAPLTLLVVLSAACFGACSGSETSAGQPSPT